MATEYFFVCKDCNCMINLGRLGFASEIVPTVISEHHGHSFKLGEDSDFLEGIEFLGYNTYDDIEKLIKYSLMKLPIM